MEPIEDGRACATVRLALPKGRMQSGVERLLADAGIELRQGARCYRPELALEGFEAKLLKPQNVIRMLAQGSRDVGFAGADWVAELDVGLVELVDTGLDPVRLVAAAPAALLDDGRLPRRELVVASEYEGLARAWIARSGLRARFVRSYGATEVFPPEDADVIVDNAASGATLAANGLVVVDELLRSSTRLYASPVALADAARRTAIEGFALLVQSVLDGRRRSMVELNVSERDLERVLEVLPCMREPTLARLAGAGGFSVRAAVPRGDLPRLIPALKARGGSDLVISRPGQIVP